VGQPGEAKEVEAELRQAVEKAVELQMEQSAYQVRRMEGELERLRKQHQELQSRRAELVRERMAAMLQAAQEQQALRNGQHE
jgi:Ni,Fe-hydrogenase III large subunit